MALRCHIGATSGCDMPRNGCVCVQNLSIHTVAHKHNIETACIYENVM